MQCILTLWDITGNILTDSSFIFAAVHPIQPENTAVNKTAWTTTSAISAPNLAVDGNPATFERILTSSWPFLAVDLGGKATLLTVTLRLWNGQCLYMYYMHAYACIV